jgi:serine/threonine-protein kinase
MTTNADLAAWGEPPASPEEEALALFLDTALERLAGGQPLQAGHLLAETPGLVEPGEQLCAGVASLCGAAGSVWEHAGLLRAADETMPDPFPGEFRVQRLLGMGGFGEVWLAEDLNLGRPVALKTLRLPPQARTATVRDTLRNEARILAALRHPNVVQVFAWRQHGDEDYVVLQYVPGGSLADRVQRDGPLPWHLAARYVADAADGLAEVHARGILHRDIKPANLLWDSETDEALLTDFGVAAYPSPSGVGAVAGTPAFMPPEAFRGQATAALDVYGLAATLFCLITGEAPFTAARTGDLVRQVERGLPDPEPRCSGLPAAVEAVIRRGLAADPEWRPGLAEFRTALRAALNQLLADTLVNPPVPPQDHGSAPPRVDLQIIISRQVRSPVAPAGARVFVPVAASRPTPERFLRDLKRVPPAPPQVELRTGDVVRVEVVANRTGFVTVFNVGPTGNLNLLYPPTPNPQPLPAGETLHIVDVELTPPAGRERVFTLWSRAPLPLRLDELLRLAEGGHVPGSGPYRATRDMVRVQRAVGRLAAEDWHAVVLQLNHLARKDPEP